MMQFFAVIGLVCVFTGVVLVVGLIAGARAANELYRPGRSLDDPEYAGPPSRLKERVRAGRET